MSLKVSDKIKSSYKDVWESQVVAGNIRPVSYYWKDPRHDIITTVVGDNLYATLKIEGNTITNFFVNLSIVEDDAKFISDMLNVSKSTLMNYKYVQYDSQMNSWMLHQ